jgi:hypothetical protein
MTINHGGWHSAPYSVAKLEIEQFFAISLTAKVAPPCDGDDPVAFLVERVRGWTVAGPVQWLWPVPFCDAGRR